MSRDVDRTAEKIALFTEWMKGDHVFVHLDARTSGVHVPPHLSYNSSLKLKLSYAFQGETRHDENGVSAFLKFDGEYVHCMMPWASIWGMTNGEGETCLWTEQLPEELAHLANIPPIAPKQKAGKKPPALTLVEKSDTKKKPVLKRIK